MGPGWDLLAGKQNTSVVAIFLRQSRRLFKIYEETKFGLSLFGISSGGVVFIGVRGSRLAAVSSTSGIAETTNGPWSRIALIYIIIS